MAELTIAFFRMESDLNLLMIFLKILVELVKVLTKV